MGPGAEFDAIRSMLERWGPLAVGIGDDAAVVEVPRGDQLVVSVDTGIDGVHFRRGWLTDAEIAYRCVTAALSDLAAMASAPEGILVSLQVTRTDDLGAIADGIAEAVQAAGTVIRGGNLARSDRLAITTTVLGSALAPLHRSTVRPGDLLYLTGRLGGPAAAVRALEGGGTPPEPVRERFARPMARIREGQWLARRGATAGIDLSDGLGGDLRHLASASGVGLTVELDGIPLCEGASADDVFGGEEYELVVASRAPLPVDEFTRAFGVPLTRIGAAREGPAEVGLTRAGTRVAPPAGYDHFSR